MILSASTLILWATMTLAKVIVLVLSWKTEHRAFTRYIGFSLLKSLALWILHLAHFPFTYFYVYYIGNMVEAVLVLAFIAGICKHLFWPCVILPRKTRHVSFVLSTLVGCILLLNAVLFPSTFPLVVERICRTVDRLSLGFCVFALLLTFGLSWFLTIPWRERTKCLASGLTLTLSVELVLSALTLNACHLINQLQWMHPAAYFLSELIWILALLRPQPERKKPTPERLLFLAEQLRSVREELRYCPSTGAAQAD